MPARKGLAGVVCATPAFSPRRGTNDRTAMANTNYYLIASDVHLRGTQNPGPPILDPLRGQVLGSLTAPMIGITPTPPTINTIVRGATSLAIGRVVKVLDSVTWFLESMPHPALGIPGAAFAPGETLNWDNGATSICNIAGSAHDYPLFAQFVSQHLNEKLNAYTPSDRADNVYWYPFAKYCEEVTLDGATIAPGEEFLRGDRCTTSGGAAFTILYAAASGLDWKIYIMRKTGTLTVGHVVTNARNGAWQAAIKSIDNAPVQGVWREHHVLPNLRGAGSTEALWEFPTAAQHPDYGPCIPIVQAAHAKHAASADIADRGTRVLGFQTGDWEGGDATIGGITVQVVKCSGSFPLTWVPGETVTSGSWSAKVHGFNAAQKYLFVTDTNGEVLTAGTVSAAALPAGSGSSATNTGAALGWQKGSSHWNAMIAEIVRGRAADDSLYSGSAAKWRGVFLMPWDSDVNTFSTAVNAAWPTLAKTNAAWVRFIGDLRTYLEDQDLPVAIWLQDARARSDVQFGGFNYSLYLRIQIESLPALIPKIAIVRSDGFEFAHNPTIGAPAPLSLSYLRPDDYQVLGERAWRGLQLYSQEIPVGNFELFPIIVIAGQSQQVGSIPSATLINIDKDPNLYPSAQFGNFAGFPGVSNLDANVLSFNTRTEEWEVYDVAANDNHFFGMSPSTCGPSVSIMARQKKRWSKVIGETGRVGMLKLAVSASCAYAGSYTSPATWDPAITTSPQTTANCKVTVFAATSMLPPRGRFTATAGTFSSGWYPGMSGFVSGSALGLQGFGGNDTAEQSVSYVVTVAPDGSYVEFAGSFVAEGAAGTGTGYLVNNVAGYAIGASVIAADTGTGTILVGDRIKFAGHATVYTLTAELSGGSFTVSPTLSASVANNEAITVQRVSFTLTAGPHALAPLVEAVVRKAFIAATDLRLIPFPALLVWENGEGDVAFASEYKAALLRVLRWMETILGGRLKGQTPIGKVIVQLSGASPTGTDEQLALVRGIQAEVVDELENAVLVDPTALPQETSGVWPIASRLQNGVHRTARGHITAGYMIDEASGSLIGIPEHPEGTAAIDFGTDGGGVFTDGAGTDSLPGEDFVGVESVGEDAPGDLIVEDGTGLANAESLVDVAWADDYWSRHGAPAWWTSSTLEQKEVALRIATRDWVQAEVALLLRGYIQTQNQRLCFPRYSCMDDNGRYVDSGTVPDWIKEATTLVAADVRAGDDLLPHETERGQVARETKKGIGFEKTIEYAASSIGSSSAKRRRKAEALVYPWLRSGGMGVARA